MALTSTSMVVAGATDECCTGAPDEEGTLEDAGGAVDGGGGGAEVTAALDGANIKLGESDTRLLGTWLMQRRKLP
jgi:hypothetical protein